MQVIERLWAFLRWGVVLGMCLSVYFPFRQLIWYRQVSDVTEILEALENSVALGPPS